jgi:hypothetical protein
MLTPKSLIFAIPCESSRMFPYELSAKREHVCVRARVRVRTWLEIAMDYVTLMQK